MRIIRRHWSAGRPIVSIAAAGMFLLQTMVVGVAAGASFSGMDAGLSSLLCSSSKTGSASRDDQPAPSRHHMGACCILHDEAAMEPDAETASPVILALTLSATLPPISLFGATRDAPELGPLSARAPPLQPA